MKSNKEDRFCPENYPISATAQNGKCSIAPWNRNYTLDGSPFFELRSFSRRGAAVSSYEIGWDRKWERTCNNGCNFRYDTRM